MTIADLIHQLRYLDPTMEVNCLLTRTRFLSDEEAEACRLPNGRWKRGVPVCMATDRPVETVQIQLDWRNPAQRLADKHVLYRRLQNL